MNENRVLGLMPEQEPSEPKPKVLILGDSLTDWTSFPEDVRDAQTLDAVEFIGPFNTGPKNDPDRIPVRDVGMGGYTTIAFARELGLNAKEYGQPSRPEVLQFFQEPAHVPDIVVIELGINDVGSGFSEGVTKKNLQLIIEFFRTLNPEVDFVLVGIPPFKFGANPALDSDIVNRNVLFVNLAAEHSTAESQILVAPYPNDGLVSPEDYAQETLANDGIHPNKLAAKTMAGPVADAIKQLSGQITKP